MSVQIGVADDGAVTVDHEWGRSEVVVRYEEDATTVQIGKVRVVVSRTQAALHVAGRADSVRVAI